MTPFTSAVGRDQIFSSTLRPRSPAGTDRPTPPRNSASSKGKRAPLLGHVVRQLVDALVEARQRHGAILVVQVGEDAREDVDRVPGRAAVAARMQVAVGGSDHDLLPDQPAQHGGDGRRLGVPHAGVADERKVGPELVLVGLDERGERGRPRLLLALEQHRHVAGQPARLAEGAQRLDEGHELALVVAGAARDDLRAVAEFRLERIRRPERERIDRLHVVMAVEQHVRGIAMRPLGEAHHHRPTCRRANRRLEAEFDELGRQPVGGAPALVRVGHVGRDRRDGE